MIQRIQTVYLALTILLSVLFLSGGFFNFTDSSGRLFEATINGVITASDGEQISVLHNTYPVTVLVLIIAVTSLITILYFRTRKLQMKLAISVMILICVLIITSLYCIWFTTTEFDARFIPGYKMVLPVLMLLFSILAFRGIRKDDNLVKSYDRLR